MADQTEATTLVNLQFLVDQIKTLGDVYQPPDLYAMPASLQAKIDIAEPLVSPLQAGEAAESAKRHDRADAHKTLVPLCSDIIYWCKSARWAKNDLDSLRSFKRELGGKPAKAHEDDPATPDIDESELGISPSQSSYPSRTEHFSNFVERLRAQSSYKPPETRFKLTTLDATTANLREFNTDISTLVAQNTQLRTQLDAPLYTDPDNAIDGANSALYYLKSSFKNTPVYNNVKHLKFTKPRRLR